MRVRSRDAHKYVESVRGEPSEAPSISWGKEQSSRYGEDLVGGWLLRHGGLTEGLQKEVQVSIPEGGNQPRRRVDWLVGRRIIVEVKTYAQSLLKGANLDNTRQFDDYARWRDEDAYNRAVLLARVAWSGNAKIESLFMQDLKHFEIPVILFLW